MVQEARELHLVALELAQVLGHLVDGLAVAMQLLLPLAHVLRLGVEFFEIVLQLAVPLLDDVLDRHAVVHFARRSRS